MELPKPTTDYIVIVLEEIKKRAPWKTAVVERLITGRDEIVRGADRGADLRISRPIQKLYLLEIRATLESTDGNRKNSWYWRAISLGVIQRERRH